MQPTFIQDFINWISNQPFCCVVIFAPGLLIPIYRWLKKWLRRRRGEEYEEYKEYEKYEE